MKSQATKLGLAGCLLALGSFVLIRSVFSVMSPASSSGGTQADGELALVQGGGPSESTSEDLIAAFGSYRPGTPVANPFVWVAQATPAAPIGETQTPTEPSTDTAPFQPAPLVVSLVMLAEPVQRAVVDGVVVGRGDPVAAGVVETITAQGITVRNGTRELIYDLRTPYPRGYQAPTQSDETEPADDPAPNPQRGPVR